MARMVKRLHNLEIDEVSLVDRPANQHGLVAIAKRDQEDNMPVFDAEGNEVYEDELSDGDLVYDEQGTEYRYTEGDPDEVDEGDDDDDEGDEPEEVGKARVPVGPLGRRAYGARARRAVGNRLSDEKLATQMFAGRHAARARRRAEPGLERVRSARSQAGEATARAGQRGRNAAIAGGMQYRALPPNARAGIRYGSTFTVGAGGASEYNRRKVRKSFGQEILTELSKALTEDDRDQVIAKAMDQFGEIAKRNDILEARLDELEAAREYEGFGEVAKSYELGADDEIAGLLYRASRNELDADDLDLLDSFFASAGQVQKAYFEEMGVVGGQQGSTLDEVYSIATEAVAKNAELGMTEEQAFVATLAANPAAYDEYEAEQRYLR